MDQAPSVDKTKCSLLISLAVPAEEDALRGVAARKQIALEKLRHGELIKEGIRDRDAEYLWLGRVGSETVVALPPVKEAGRVVMGTIGPLGAAARVIRARRAFEAQRVIQLGMAFGINRQVQDPGDVLVSTSLFAYDCRTIRGDGEQYLIEYDPTSNHPASDELVNLFRREQIRILQREQLQSDFGYRVQFGSILTGSTRIQSRVFRDELVNGVLDTGVTVIGGEMEGAGLLAASIGRNSPVWCLVKGISDFADEQQPQDAITNRSLACTNAADFVLSALANHTPDFI